MPKKIKALITKSSGEPTRRSSTALPEKVIKTEPHTPRWPRRTSSVSEIPVIQRQTKSAPRQINAKTSIRIDNRDDLSYHLKANKERLLYIKKLDMNWTNIEKDDLENLLRAMPLLQELDIWHCQNIKAGTFTKLPSDLFGSLEKIDLSFTHASNKDIQALLEAATHLINIDLLFCQKIRDSVFTTLKPNSLQALKTAKLGALKIKISDIHDLIRAAPNLTEIHLTDCPYITTSDLETIPAHITIK